MLQLRLMNLKRNQKNFKREIKIKEWISDKWETSKDWVIDRKEERTSLDGIALIAMGVIALFFTPFVKFAAYGAIIYGAYTLIKSEW